MKNYKVMLSRNYIVNISASNEEEAMFLSEFFVSSVIDASNENDRKKYRFNINNIEMSINEAFEVEENNESE